MCFNIRDTSSCCGERGTEKRQRTYPEDSRVVVHAGRRLRLVDRKVLHLRRAEDDVCVRLAHGRDELVRGPVSCSVSGAPRRQLGAYRRDSVPIEYTV